MITSDMQTYVPQKINLQILRNQIGGSFEFDDEGEIPQTIERKPETKDFPIEGRLTFVNKTTEGAAVATIKSLEVVARLMPKAGHELKDTADAIGELLINIAGIGANKQEAKNPQKEAEEKSKKQEGFWILSKTKEITSSILAVAKERIQAINIKSLREQVNTALGLSKTNEQTVNATGSIRTDVQIAFDKALADAEKKKKASAFSMASLRLGKKSYGPNLNLNQVSEKTAGGTALTTVG